MVILWTVIIVILVVVLILGGLILMQYAKMRKHMPKPPYKQAAQQPQPQTWSDDRITVAWVGHSTLLINLFGFKILTDPVFSEKVGVRIAGRVIGPRRHTAPAMRLDEVGNVDLILLSHAHLDHFDLPSLRKLVSPRTQVVLPKGTSRLLRGMTFDRVFELHGKEQVELDNGVKIIAVPVRHWGARFPWNRDYHWTGYLIEHQGARLFFAGDTAHTPTIQQLRELGKIDIAMIPIGAYSPDSFQGSHCTPEQAWEMFRDCGAEWLIPIHWDTFVLSHEPVEEPMQRLLQAAAADQLSDRIVIYEHGASFELPDVRVNR
jgi:L-ascorbate metabolism protein UlaG (beta-lactamase superfamily)